MRRGTLVHEEVFHLQHEPFTRGAIEPMKSMVLFIGSILFMEIGLCLGGF
jgi:hypothetical protein